MKKWVGAISAKTGKRLAEVADNHRLVRRMTIAGVTLNLVFAVSELKTNVVLN
jgi:hypothetical protein